MRINRRSFLGFAAGATAGVTTGAPSARILSDFIDAAEPDVYPPRGPEDEVLSVCAMCAGGCGLRARRIGGRVVKLDGNPLHPVNRGRLCPKGQAGLQSLYHPDRLAGPMHRIGPRGTLDSFERTSWDDALAEIAERLSAVRARSPGSLFLVRDQLGGIDGRAAAAFVHAFGSANDLILDPGGLSSSLAFSHTQGIVQAPIYDISTADYLLSVGGALLEASNSPVSVMREYGDFRRGRPGHRGKLVQVEPRESITAASADEWIRVRPGSEGAFAMGVASVLLAEKLYDQTFVRTRTNGLEGRDGLHELLDRRYTLEQVIETTGVPGSDILRIAREFAAARSPLAIGPYRGPLLETPLFDHLASQALNALVGNIDKPGGVLVPVAGPTAPWPDPPAPVAGISDLVERLHAESDTPAEALFVLGADPAYLAPDPFARAVERIPLVVSFASMADDTALAADWILPQPHYLERWDLFRASPGTRFSLASLARPALEQSLCDVQTPAEVFLEISRREGGELAEALRYDDLGALIRAEVKGIAAAQRGSVMGRAFDEELAQLMDRSGWWAPRYRSARELWNRMRETGGWWDPIYDHGDWQRVLHTSSGRFEFRPDLLSELAPPIPSTTGASGAPGVSSQRVALNDGSLALRLFEPLPIAGARGSELPFLQAILDPALEEQWDSWVEIHPETAALLGVANHDRVELRSVHGRATVRVRVTERVVPGLAALPVGLGRRGGGRWASGRGANAFELLASSPTDSSNRGNDERVRVRLAIAEAPNRPGEERA